MKRILFLLINLLWLIGLSNTALLAQVKLSKVKTKFSIKAVDDRTCAELPADYIIKTILAKKQYTGKSTATEAFAFILDRTDTLDVQASSPGYLIAQELMVVSCDTCADYEYVIRLEKDTRPDDVFHDLETGKTIQLDKVYFDQSSYVLRPESYPQLDKLVKTLTQSPSLKIEIAGHTDNVGDRRLNQALSENRAKIITSYLIRHGIPEARLQYNGYGDTRPAAPNDVEENKRKNRRVEFMVLAK